MGGGSRGNGGFSFGFGSSLTTPRSEKDVLISADDVDLGDCTPVSPEPGEDGLKLSELDEVSVSLSTVAGDSLSLSGSAVDSLVSPTTSTDEQKLEIAGVKVGPVGFRGRVL